MIDEVKVLPRGLADSSVGGLRGRSERFFDTACSRNEDLFVLRRLLEKLPSVCEDFGLRENIFEDRYWSADLENVVSRLRISVSSKVVVVVVVLSRLSIFVVFVDGGFRRCLMD